MGEAKILVEVELSKAFPTRIAAGDEKGFISMVDVEYAWLPTKCSRCGQLGHKIKRCLQTESGSHVVVNTTAGIETRMDAEVVIRSCAPNVLIDAHQLSNSVGATTEVPTTPTIASANEVNITKAHPPTVLASKTILESIKSSLVEIPPFSPASASRPAHVTVQRDGKQVEHSTPKTSSGKDSNHFAYLSVDEDETLVSAEDSDPLDLMTPTGKRILRDRPVKPSTKAKEMSWQVVAAGRGNYGRGNRGGRG
ncbi:uncharacterized protein LOC18014899 [Eutrema salsugineum]|uniref:uncharacterized protein LOC18014899 n=1 Tax=Eutrema salsugineum TaxID=72664 RepID=UPI000CED1F51|nr:uncharacterized protein LOC18014899 [Eutrema salsugineum]